jgi:hypothetical protein
MSVNTKPGDKNVAQCLCLLRERAQTVKDDLQSLVALVTSLDCTFTANHRV